MSKRKVKEGSPNDLRVAHASDDDDEAFYAAEAVRQKTPTAAPPPADDALTDGNGRSFDAGHGGPIGSGAYSEDEKKLTNFVRLHPMLSTEALSRETLQAMSTMMERQPIRVNSVPIVGKRYEDGFLRPARKECGERPCVLGDQCVVHTIAKLRRSPHAFTCREFLLPEENEKWLSGGGPPERPGKCLVCLRYFTTYVYYCARNDPEYAEALRRFAVQRHGNVLCGEVKCEEAAPTMPPPSISEGAAATSAAARSGGARRRRIAPPTGSAADGDIDWHDAQTANKLEFPKHANAVDVEDGYLRSAMIFCDEPFMDSRAARESPIGALAWRPFARFDASHLRFDVVGGEPRLTQVGVSPVDPLNGRPPPASVGRAAGALLSTA